MEYHLLTSVCRCLILSLAVLFLWSNASTFIDRSPPNIPEVKIPEDMTVNIVLSLRFGINRSFTTLREIGHGRDLKKFLIVIAGLWVFICDSQKQSTQKSRPCVCLCVIGQSMVFAALTPTVSHLPLIFVPF